jgi:hypothetical protein
MGEHRQNIILGSALCPFEGTLMLKGSYCHEKNNFKNICVFSEKVCNNASGKLYSEYSLLP